MSIGEKRITGSMPDCSTPQKESPILSDLTRLMTKLGELKVAIRDLRSRLALVSVPENPCASEADVKGDDRSVIGTRIVECAEFVNELDNEVRIAIHDLEI